MIWPREKEATSCLWEARGRGRERGRAGGGCVDGFGGGGDRGGVVVFW